MPTHLDPDTADATRREFLALLTAAGLLTGCAAAPEPSPSDAAGGFPRIVDHALGSTTVPTRPERVFTSQTALDVDTVLALALVPAAIGTGATAAR